MALGKIFAIAAIIAGHQVTAFAPCTHIIVEIKATGRQVTPKCALSKSLPSLRAEKVRKLFLSLESDGDDDGWGTSESNVATEQGDSGSLRSKKERDLQALRSQVESKANTSRAASGSTDNQEQERDLFIPIFALVSLTGLFGAYGYEILRLYLRGELYLPWTQ
jgi:hypothetical protein